MTLFIRLLRLGRIFRPKYDIIVYKNYRPVGRIGVLHPFRDLKLRFSKVKVLKLHIEEIRFWQNQGLVLPPWIASLVNPLFISPKYDAIKMHHTQQDSHIQLISQSGLVAMKPFNLIRGKTHGRAILRALTKKKRKNAKKNIT